MPSECQQYRTIWSQQAGASQHASQCQGRMELLEMWQETIRTTELEPCLRLRSCREAVAEFLFGSSAGMSSTRPLCSLSCSAACMNSPVLLLC